jgi:hypothetical protein
MGHYLFFDDHDLRAHGRERVAGLIEGRGVDSHVFGSRSGPCLCCAGRLRIYLQLGQPIRSRS